MNRKVSADLVIFRREPYIQYVGVDRIKLVLQCIRAEGLQMYCFVYDMIIVWHCTINNMNQFCCRKVMMAAAGLPTRAHNLVRNMVTLAAAWGANPCVDLYF